MRHGIKSKHFNRDVHSRKALLRELVTAVVKHGEIKTTMPKAKEVRRIADRLIHKAQTDSVATRRTLHRFFGKRDVVNTLVERVAPAMTDRASGFTRISSQGKRRGDNALMVTLALVTKPEVTGTLKAGKKAEVEAKETKAKPTKKKPVAKKTVKKVTHQPDSAIQQQARADEAQTGLKGNAPVKARPKTIAGK